MSDSRSLLTKGWLVAALWLFTACGGSGSGGFDIQGNEQHTIDTVTGTDSCVPASGTIVCAPGVTIPHEFIDPSSGIAPSAHAEFILPMDPNGLPCTLTPTGACMVTLDIAAVGFPTGTTFVAATRPESTGATWRTGNAPFDPLAEPAQFQTTATLLDPAPTYLAVLVFLPGSPVPPLSTAPDLGAFNADVVIVAPPVPIDPQTSATIPTDGQPPPLPLIP